MYYVITITLLGDLVRFYDADDLLIGALNSLDLVPGALSRDYPVTEAEQKQLDDLIRAAARQLGV